MAVIPTLGLALLAMLPQGGEASKPAPKPLPAGITLDSHGYPVTTGVEPTPIDPPTRAEVRLRQERLPELKTLPPAPAVEPQREPPASGLAAGSPLLDVFAAVRAPGSFRALGGVTAYWRLTVYGAQGEVIGLRDVTHKADLTSPDRDRMEYADGRVYGRAGNAVFAQRDGLPWQTLVAAAAPELQLFGLQLRLPWVFADGNAYVVLQRETVVLGDARLTRIRLQPRAEVGPLGPDPDQKPRDQYELWCDHGGLPVELVHTLAASGQTRRVQFDDWRDLDGVRVPCRRTYVDGAGRPTTRLELLNLETRQAFAESTFRLQ